LNQGLIAQLKAVKTYTERENLTEKRRKRYAFPFDPQRKTSEYAAFTFDENHKASGVVLSNDDATASGKVRYRLEILSQYIGDPLVEIVLDINVSSVAHTKVWATEETLILCDTSTRICD
jgi:hypothetical protein